MSAASSPGEGVSLGDFHAYMPMHSYIYAPSRELWPGSSVNGRIARVQLEGVGDDGKPKTISPSAWLDRHRPVEQMTWAPGEPMEIRDRLIAEGGWISRKDVTCFNLYRPPMIALGDARKADPWRDHVYRVYPNDAEHIIKWLAHRVQHPGVKVNHAILLGGSPGTGKDTLLEPVKQAIGPWNFGEASPTQVLGRFNGFLKSVVLRISEARDLGEFDRFAFYDHMKTALASPPDTLRVDEKHLREHSILNCVGVVITSNHKSDGIYLPADDRRHYVAWTELKKEDFPSNYWNRLWGWYHDGGFGHVAAFLSELDLSTFDPKAPPPKTEAFWAIADSNRSGEESELADVLELIGNPDATTIARIAHGADLELSGWLKDRKNRRLIPHRLEKVGYIPVRNEYADDGLWKLNGKRQAVYAKSALSVRGRYEAAADMVKRAEAPAGQ